MRRKAASLLVFALACASFRPAYASSAGDAEEAVSRVSVIGELGGVSETGGAMILVAFTGAGPAIGGTHAAVLPHARIWVCDLRSPCTTYSFPITIDRSGDTTTVKGSDPALGAVDMTFGSAGNSLLSYGGENSYVTRMCFEGETTTIRVHYIVSGGGVNRLSSAHAASAEGSIGPWQLVRSDWRPYPAFVGTWNQTYVYEQDEVVPC